MAPRRSRPRRLLLPTVLAVILVTEITGIALARSLAPVGPIAATSAIVATSSASAPASHPSTAVRPDATDSGRWSAPAVAPGPRSHRAVRSTAPAAGSTRTIRTLTQRIKPKVASPARTTHASTTRQTTAPTFHGQNHVWISSLGISAGIQSFPCSRSRPPDAGVYRWDCAGRNNVYLLGHAWSTFQPLHDAYVGGRLHAGLKVVYADGAGSVHTYSVIWWKVVAPTTAASWAWASLDTPSMTLQTCVGADSQYRLMVRLLRVS
jgi:hypothetical protein